MTAKTSKAFGYEELVVAVDLPTAVAEKLTRAGIALKQTANPLHMEIFWIPANITHISVLHTVRVREDLVDTVVETLRDQVEEIAPVMLHAIGLTLYQEGEGEERVARSIWCKLAETEALVAMREKLADSLAGLDVATADVDVTPHIPLALLEDFRNTREFNSAFVEWEEHDFGEVPVHALMVKKAIPAEDAQAEPFGVVAMLPLTGDKAPETE